MTFGKTEAPRFSTVRRLGRLLGTVLGLAALGFVLKALFDGADQIGQVITKIDAVVWLGALGLLTGCHLLGALYWWWIVRGLGERISLFSAFEVHLLAALAKYVPGGAWQIIGKVTMANRAGISKATGSLSIALEMAFIYASGTGIALVMLPNMGSAAGIEGSVPAVAAATALFLVVTLLVAQWTIRRRAKEVDRSPRLSAIVRAGVATLFTWPALGLATLAIVASISPVGLDRWPIALFSTAVGYVGSMLAVAVPAGLGVREGLMTLLLATIMPVPVAALAAILLRATSIVAELLAAGAVLLIRLRAGRDEAPGTLPATNLPS